MTETVPLEKQVCSLDLAKRLKELGAKQESLWHWHVGCDKRPPEIRTGEAEENNACGCRNYSALTVAELGRMLPVRIGCAGWNSGPDGEEWSIGYFDPEAGLIGEVISARTEADARASMLCQLIEKGLVKP
jgi:hypothetical protein